MAQLQLHREEDVIVLRVRGTLDGSAAWRLCRVSARLAQRRTMYVDLADVERLLSFGAAVLGARLPLLAPRVQLRGVRPEHARLLRLSGALSAARPDDR